MHDNVLDKHTNLCYPVLCLPALSLDRRFRPGRKVSLANPDLLAPRYTQFCLLPIQLSSFQAIADIPPQRPLSNPLPINHFRTLFLATEGVPPVSHFGMPSRR